VTDAESSQRSEAPARARRMRVVLRSVWDDPDRVRALEAGAGEGLPFEGRRGISGSDHKLDVRK